MKFLQLIEKLFEVKYKAIRTQGIDGGVNSTLGGIS